MASSTAAKISCSQFGYSYTPSLVLHGHSSCCESGRPLHDGVGAHSVCPCQLDRVLQHRVPSVPVSVLPRPNFSETTFQLGAADLSAFYGPLTRPCDLKDPSQSWRDPWYLAQAARHPFDLHNFDPRSHPACTAFGERFSPIDLAAAGARRKNATRETTSTLKAWLYEHRKNPYPTKGEKIMLAIITKMTLTQVSTWFANARRRLKKENKMTWSPRNRCGEKKDSGDGSDSDCEGIDDGDLDDVFEKDDERADIKDVEEREERKENIETNERREKESYLPCNEKKPNVTTKAIWKAPSIQPVSHSSESSVEDSPVKSLRKWVDGCFHDSAVPVCVNTNTPVAVTDTPPATPPHRTSTECPVIASAPRLSSGSPPALISDKKIRESPMHSEKQSPIQKRDSESSYTKDELAVKALAPSERRSPERANYREFDAALALTTLSSR